MEQKNENIFKYQNYSSETNWLWNEDDQLDFGYPFSWAMDQPFNGFEYGDHSSSRDTSTSATALKNIVREKTRRKKLSDKLLELREVVPKTSKLDQPSIIKEAIQYIQDLQEKERKLQAEIMELESKRMLKKSTRVAGYDFEHELPVLLRSKKTRSDERSTTICCPIEVLDSHRKTSGCYEKC